MIFSSLSKIYNNYLSFHFSRFSLPIIPPVLAPGPLHGPSLQRAEDHQGKAQKLESEVPHLDLDKAAERVGAVFSGRKLPLKVLGKDFSAVKRTLSMSWAQLRDDVEKVTRGTNPESPNLLSKILTEMGDVTGNEVIGLTR